MKRLLFLFLTACPVVIQATDGLNANYADVALAERNQFINENGDLILRAIQVEGLERTKPYVVSREFRHFLNHPLSKLDLEFALDRLHRKGIFSKISVSFRADTETDATLIVFAEDKWTFIPVPVVNITRGVQTYGLFLYEPNFLGRHKTLFLGFLGSNIGLQGLAGYIDNHVNNSDFFFQQIFEGGKVRHDNGEPNGNQLESYEVNFAKITTQFGYLIAHILQANLLIKTKFSQVENGASLQSVRAASANSIGVGTRLFLQAAKHRGYYKEGFEGFLDILHGFAVTPQGSSYDEIIGALRYTMPAFADHSLSFTVFAASGDVTAVYENRLGGVEGSRTLPADFIAADRYASHTLRYEHPLFTPSWGVFTLTEFFESGYYQNDDLGQKPFYGPGIGFRFYLKNLALPAVGFDLAYEIQSKATQLSFALGFVR